MLRRQGGILSTETGERLLNLTLGVATLFFTAVAFAASIFGGREGEHQQQWIIAGVVASAVAVYAGNSERVRLSAYRARMQRSALQAQRNYESLIANLAPSTAQAAVLGDRTLPAPEQSVRRGRFDQSVVVGVSEISEGSRGVFYSWNSTTRIFTLVSQWPSSALPEITSGDAVYPLLELIVKGGSTLRMGDIASPFDRTPPPVADERVAVVQVKVNATAIGILVLDGKMPKSAPPPDGFSARDLRELLLYADMLAATLGAG